MKAITILITAMVSLQFGATIAKGLFAQIGSNGTTTLRVLFASIILTLIFKPWKDKFSRRELSFVCAYGISLGLMNLTFYEALNYAPLGIVVAIEFLGPLSVSILYSRNRIDYIWAIIAGVGILLIMPFEENSLITYKGVLFSLAAAVCWALYIIFGKKIGNNHSSGKIASLGMCFAALTTILFGINDSLPAFRESNLLISALLVAIFSSAIPYTLEMISLTNMKEKTFGVLMSLEPAVAMIIGFIFLHEKLEIVHYAGIIFIIIASLGTVLSVNKEK